jgi:hypothetical protein
MSFGIRTTNGRQEASRCHARSPFPDAESAEGLGVREKSRLEYDYIRQLTIN